MSVVTTGEEALAKDPERRARGLSPVEGRTSTPVEELPDNGLTRFEVDFMPLRECIVLERLVSSTGAL